MQITRQQRINGIPAEMIGELRRVCERFREVFKDGVKKPPAYPDFECTGAEVKEAFGGNLKDIETVIEFVLDGKSNRMPGVGKKA